MNRRLHQSRYVSWSQERDQATVSTATQLHHPLRAHGIHWLRKPSNTKQHNELNFQRCKNGPDLVQRLPKIGHPDQTPKRRHSCWRNRRCPQWRWAWHVSRGASLERPTRSIDCRWGGRAANKRWFKRFSGSLERRSYLIQDDYQKLILSLNLIARQWVWKG